MRRIWLASIILFSLLAITSIQAQENLLNDPGFEGSYTGRGRADFNIPQAWGGWWTGEPSTESWMNVEPLAFPHTGPNKRGGNQSIHVDRGFGTFTAAVYQQVPGIAAGTRLRATAWAFLESDSSANGQVRIGIGNGTGGSPFGDIVWSPWSKNYGGWQEISVEAVAKGGEITVFLYATQTWPRDPNGVYWDDATLTAIGTGEVPSDTGGGDTGGAQAPVQPTTPPRPAGVPVVSAQSAGDDGSIVHIVQSGDTINSIAVAYGVSRDEIIRLNNISNARFISVGQQLIIREAQPTAEPSPTRRPTNTPTRQPSATPDTSSQQVAQVASPTRQPSATPVPEEDDNEVVVQDVTGLSEFPTIPPPVVEADQLEPTATRISQDNAPSAPVVADGVLPQNNIASVESTICVLLFDDENQNRLREGTEDLIARGAIGIQQLDGTLIANHTTDGVSEPFCFEGLAQGQYVAVIDPPSGYGPTTASRLQVNLQPGTQFNIAFGAAEGVAPLRVPTAVAVDNTIVEPEVTDTGDNATQQLIDTIVDNSGLIIFGLAGFLLVAGLGASIFLRRN